MKRISIFIATTALLLGACSNTEGTREDNTIRTGVQSTLKETLDTAIAANVKPDEPGLIMAVWQDGDSLYQGQRGMASKDQPISEKTRFRLASVSKTFTAIAVMQLYEAGKIKLEDKILDYFPEFDPSWQDISIHQLLSHRSGIPDFANDFVPQKILPNGITNPNVIEYFVRHPELEYEPGTDAQYSNTGYVILAELVARITGVSFADYMAQSVFSKIGMKDSYIFDEYADIKPETALNFANTHDINGKGFWSTGTAGQISSLQDMLTFVATLTSEELIANSSKALMLEPYSDISVFSGGYGYGLAFFNPQRGVIGHTGGHGGFRTIFAYSLEKNAAVIILGNGGDALPEYTYLIDLVGEFVK